MDRIKFRFVGVEPYFDDIETAKEFYLQTCLCAGATVEASLAAQKCLRQAPASLE